MQTMLAAGLLCLTTLFCLSTAHACERRQPQDNGDDRTRHVALSASMPDARILQSLKLTPGRGEIERKESSGSVTVRYTYFHKIVTITRSTSSGVTVEMREKEREPLVWKLGTC